MIRNNRTYVLGLLLLAACAACLLAGCNINKYDTWNQCELSDGRYQIRIVLSHDSSEPKEVVAPRTYAKLCTELVGGPGVSIDKPVKP